MHIKFSKPAFDAMGSPLKTQDQLWHAVLCDDVHRGIASGVGKTKAIAREALQRDINGRMESKLRKYTAMLNFVTNHEVE